MVQTDDYPLEFSWLCPLSTVMQKTIPTLFEDEVVARVAVFQDNSCVIVEVRHF